MRQSLIFITSFLVLLLPSVQAQILDDVLGSVTDSISDITDEVLPGITNIRVGIGPAVSPDYEGSNDYELSAAPLVSLRYRDLVFVDNNRIRVNILGSETLIDSENFKAGPSLALNFGRDEKDSIDLTGMGDVGTSVELGGFLSYQVGPTRARIRVRQDVASGHSGMQIIGDFRVLLLSRGKVTIVTTFRSSWGNNTYMDSFFRVGPARAVASGLPLFESSSGFKDVGVSLATNYQISDKWAVVGNAGYKRLMGDAKDSPIVSLRGSADQLVGGIFAVYSF